MKVFSGKIFSNFLGVFALVFCLAGCGYQSVLALPSLDFASVKASTKIMKEDARTSVLIVDEFYDYLQNSLGLRLADDALVSVQMRVQKAAYTPIYYDALGHAKSYRAVVALEWKITDKRATGVAEIGDESKKEGGAGGNDAKSAKKTAGGNGGGDDENKSKQKLKIFTTKGEYIFNTNSLSALSDDEKSKALKEAATAALSEFASVLGEQK